MFSFLSEVFGLLLGVLTRIPRQIVNEFDLLVDGFIEFFRNWLDSSLDSTQQTMASERWSVGPPGDWLTFVCTFLRPNRLARVRVPKRRTIH